MLALLANIWKGVQAVLKLLLPRTFIKLLTKGRRAPDEIAGRAIKGKPAWLRGFLWAVRLLLVIAILIALYLLGTLKPVRDAIQLSKELAPFFLPVLALLIYGLVWLGAWLWQLLLPEHEESPYPDIDLAWDEAMRALEQAGTDVTSAPLFLIVGKPAEAEEALLEASGLALPVSRVPPRAAAPLHVYAGPDAILVTCSGVGLLSELCDMLAGVKEPVMDGDMDGSPSIRLGGGTMLPNANLIKVQKILRGASGRKLNEDEHRELAKLYARGEAQQGHMVDRAKQSLLKDPNKVAEATGRLRRLCQLIVRARRPYCSVNGLLFLIPVAGAASDLDASLTGEICQRDHAVARSALQVDCPVFALVCDVETIPGFSEFRGSFAEEELTNRIGQRYPLVPDLEEEEIPASIDGALQWIGDGTLAGWVYRFFQVEKNASREETAEATRRNARLYQFLGTIRERIRRLSRVLTNGLLKQQGERPLFGGCYIAGTGRAASDQAFSAGVFRRLLREQDNVAWTQQAFDQEAQYQRMIGIGYLVLAALAVVDAALIVWAIRIVSSHT